MTVLIRTPYLMLTSPVAWYASPATTAVVVIDFGGWATCSSCGILGGAAVRGIGTEFGEYRAMVAEASANIQTILDKANRVGSYAVAIGRPDPIETATSAQDPRGTTEGCVGQHSELTSQIAHVDRQRLSIFSETPLEAELKRRGIATLILCGTLANRTLRLAAYEAVDRDFRPFVVMDASASESADTHAIFGMEVNGGPIRAGTMKEALALLSAEPA